MFEKGKDLFPKVNDPKLFGHDGDAKIADGEQKSDLPADTRGDWYGHDDVERDKDAGLTDQELAVKKEQEELGRG